MKHLLPILFICYSTISGAQIDKNERKIQVDGYIADSFTDLPVPGVKIVLMNADSMVVDSVRSFELEQGTFYACKLPRTKSHYLFRFEHKDYETKVVPYYHKPMRHDYIHLPKVYIKRKQQKWTANLDEVVVTATKIKVAHRGDTIVFDATAFNVAEGSMLDALIRQMPGTELKANGEIFVNGEKIDYMLLNGQEFYRGNNRLMLDNLPYYMVQNVKVYDRNTNRAQYTGLKNEKKDYVMDVNLKRQYREGYIANAEAGGGTEESYIGRLFGLRFTDHSRLTLVGNINNLNTQYQPNTNGRWDEGGDFGRDGRTTRKELSGGLQIDSKKWKNNIETSAGWTKTKNEERSNTETILPENSPLQSQSNSTSVGNMFTATATNNFTLKAPFYFNSYTSMTYNTNDGISTMSYNSQPSSQYMRSDRNNRSVNISQKLASTHKLYTGDALDLHASAGYSNYKNKLVEERNTTLGATSRRQLRSINAPVNTYNYDVGAGYSLNDLTLGTYQLNLSYMQEHKSEDNLRTDLHTGMKDEDNSYHLSQMQRTFNTTLRYGYNEWGNASKAQVEILLPMRYVNRRTHYTKSIADMTVNQRRWLISPNMKFSWKKYSISANYTQKLPDAMLLINTSDTNDPLHTYLGNPDLKTPSALKLGLRYIDDQSWTTGKQVLIWADWSRKYNQIMQAYTYNPQTGQFTYRPRNIDGNWDASINATYNNRLGKESPLWIGSDLNMNFSRTSDYSGISLEENSIKRAIKYLNWNEELKLLYERDGITVALKGGVQSYRTSSDSPSFETVNAMHYKYGIDATLTLPWEISLNTNIFMEQRRGYANSSLNTDECVWNMTIGRSFLKGKRLLVRLTAIDILRDYSAVSYHVSSSGRTETWRYSLPAYFLLRASYKFDVNPKK